MQWKGQPGKKEGDKEEEGERKEEGEEKGKAGSSRCKGCGKSCGTTAREAVPWDLNMCLAPAVTH